MQAADKSGSKRKRKAEPGEETGEAILRWRVSGATISKEELAAHLGRSMSTIQRWERGAQEPRLSDVRAMEEYKPGLVALLFPRTKPPAHQNGSRA